MTCCTVAYLNVGFATALPSVTTNVPTSGQSSEMVRLPVDSSCSSALIRYNAASASPSSVVPSVRLYCLPPTRKQTMYSPVLFCLRLALAMRHRLSQEPLDRFGGGVKVTLASPLQLPVLLYRCCTTRNGTQDGLS